MFAMQVSVLNNARSFSASQSWLKKGLVPHHVLFAAPCGAIKLTEYPHSAQSDPTSPITFTLLSRVNSLKSRDVENIVCVYVCYVF